MAWNEPGGNNDKDPWGNDQGPPDLDEAFRKFKEKFTGGKGGSGSGSGAGGDLPEISAAFIAVVFIVLGVLWWGLGWYTVDQQEEGVVLRFGKYNETVSPGLQWNPPLIDSVQKVNVTKVRSATTLGLMLTKDDNIVQISLSVQYTVNDVKKFLLEVRDPERSLQHAAESALRHVIGSALLDDILTEGRAAIAVEIQERLQLYLDNYATGIKVATVNIENAQPPAQVKEAFADVQRAKEDETRVKNQAETYRNGIIPEARGLAQRQIEEADGYKEQVVAQAKGEASRFTQLLTEYEKAPKVTRQRLYIDTMEKMMGNASKVMVDVDGGNLLYLPLDKLMSHESTDSTVKTNSGIFEPSTDAGKRESRRAATRREAR